LFPPVSSGPYIIKPFSKVHLEYKDRLFLSRQNSDIKTVINTIDENEDLGLNNWIFFYEEFVPISLTRMH
jgi:hypothetical protein